MASEKEKTERIAKHLKIDPRLVAIVSKVSRDRGLAVELVMSVVLAESGGNTFANRYEENWKWFFKPSYWAKRWKITDKTERINQAMSWGLMQVMGTTAREMGYSKPLPELCIPAFGLDMGCKYLAKQICRYAKKANSIEYGVSAYNMGTARVRLGKFGNQKYVTRVILQYKELMEIKQS